MSKHPSIPDDLCELNNYKIQTAYTDSIWADNKLNRSERFIVSYIVNNLYALYD